MSGETGSSNQPSAGGGGGGGQTVQVVLRIRPTADGCPTSQLAVTASGPTELTFLEGGTSKRRFTFDSVVDVGASQQHVFDTVGAPCVGMALKGFNGCILAYGQSHSGKTHTMLGPNGGAPEGLTSCGGPATGGQSSAAGDHVGIIPRAFRQLFQQLRLRPACEVESTVDVSAVELYNEVLYDLLPGGAGEAMDSGGVTALASQSPAASAPPSVASSSGGGSGGEKPIELRIREDRSPNGRGIFVDGLSTRRAASDAEALALLRRAAERKHMGGTLLNETSSRSHTIVIVSVTQTDLVMQGTVTAAQLFLVDLAGSERIEKTGAVGDRLKEAQNINLSLTLLGNVINKLTEPGSLHIPYRDSKLTRLLQDALGGNAITTLICAVSPETQHSSETLSTLLFAQRAKRITNRPTANKVLGVEEVRRELAAALHEVEVLREQVRGLAGIGGVPLALASSSPTASHQRASHALAGGGGGSGEVDELRATIRSLLNELEQERSDGIDKDRQLQLLAGRVKFHEGREGGLAEACVGWERKYVAEKLHAEAAMAKLLSLAAPNASTSSSSSSSSVRGASATTMADVPAVNRNDSQARVQPKLGGLNRGASMTKLPAGGKQSNSGGASAASAVAVPAPLMPVATLPVAPAEVTTTASTPPQSPAMPTADDANSLVRERMLLRQVDALREELTGARKFAVMCDKLMRDVDFLKAESAKALDDLRQKHAADVKAMHSELADTREENTSLQGTLLTVMQEKATLEGRVQDLSARIASSGGSREPHGGGKSADVQQHLELENRELHTENRANAVRLLDFTRRIEALSKEVGDLKTARETLCKELESLNLDMKTKERLLLLAGSGKGDKDKSYFRRKLLECFSYE